ncbi:MAG: hypothetical protein EOM76_08935 [Sphingobacteriia bacterium]|nr:hypothetical protein [Sphingobacteriia bacterium]
MRKAFNFAEITGVHGLQNFDVKAIGEKFYKRFHGIDLEVGERYAHCEFTSIVVANTNYRYSIMTNGVVAEVMRENKHSRKITYLYYWI